MKIYGYCEQDNGITCPGNYADMDGCFEGACSAGQIGGEDADLSGTAICLGDFDGVHKGHMRLFELAKSCGKWGVLLLNRQERQGVLTTLSERLDIIEALGADYAVIAEFSRGFAEKSPEEFADLLWRTLKIGTAVVGYDYRFGHKALGDAQRLKELLKDRAEVIVADAVTCCGQPIKSTKIRELIKNGDLTAACALMGRNYPVKAVIASGKQNGRRLGFPTANFDVSSDKILPPDGVYYGIISGHCAVINIGKNPTFNASRRTFEAHIIDYDGDLYGKIMTAVLIEKIRGEISFESMAELKNQIMHDVEYAKNKFK